MESSILSIFKNIQNSAIKAKNCFTADNIPLSQSHKIGVSDKGCPIFFIQSSILDFVPDINLDLISVKFNQICRLKIHQTKGFIDNYYTIVKLKTDDPDFIEYFLNIGVIVLSKLGDNPSQKMLLNEIQKLIDLFRHFSAPPKKTIQGLWAELFIISQSKNPDVLLSSWHVTENDIFDFNDGYDKLEVKSTSLPKRIHNFSLAQLTPNNGANLIIVSIFAIQSGKGKNIIDLKTQIETKIDSTELKYKLNEIILQTIGSDFANIRDYNFDYQQAIDSCKFISSKDVPKIAEKNIPPEISNIHFQCDLSQIQAIENISEEYPHSNLFKSL